MGWERLSVQDKARRYKRLAAAGRIFPEVESLCEKHGIVRTEPTEGSFHFEYHDYIIVWPVATNRITVQYRLPQHNRRVRFFPPQIGKAKILMALEEVILLHEMERSTSDLHSVGSGCK